MATRARHSTESTAYGPYAAEAHDTYDELWPGERNGPPPSRTRSKAMRRGAFIILIALGGGWALLGDRATWPDWQSIETAVSAWMNRSEHGSPKPATLAVATTAPPTRTEQPAKAAALDTPPLIIPNRSTAIPDAPAGSETAPKATAAPPHAGTDYGKEQASPLPPPTADPADPYRIRAEAVGLHPDLSRVLLDRLSPADYRNAGIAIRTAVAETSDDGVFVWPRQRKPELALFKVRFVAGAAAGCRRYVVTITMDGWLTTALPMEKCGTQARQSPRK